MKFLIIIDFILPVNSIYIIIYSKDINLIKSFSNKMAQNNSLKLKKKNEKDAKKFVERKNKPNSGIDKEKNPVIRNIRKEMHKSQKKVYKNIENMIIQKAKHKRENLEIL